MYGFEKLSMGCLMLDITIFRKNGQIPTTKTTMISDKKEAIDIFKKLSESTYQKLKSINGPVNVVVSISDDEKMTYRDVKIESDLHNKFSFEIKRLINDLCNQYFKD